MSRLRSATRLRSLSITPLALLTTVLLCAGTATAAPPGKGSDGLGDPYYPKDGNGGYDVSHYDIRFGYQPSAKHLAATTTITARTTQSLRAFNLDYSGPSIHAVGVNGRSAEWHRHGQHELTITPQQPLSKGAPFTVTVRYSGKPKPVDDPALGKNGWQYGRDGAAFAAGEPHGAASWFPVNDSPLDKATYEFTGTLPKPWSMIANGTEQPVTSGPGAHRRTFHWTERVPTASYLSTVAIDKWTFERGKLADGTPLVSAYAPGTPAKTKKAEHRLPEVLDFLSSKFGRYPADGAGGIFVGTSVGFSLETESRPIYSNDMGDLDTIIHENTHQWWGDSTSVKRWKDVCLNECFASYATWLWDEAKSGDNLDKRYAGELEKHRGDKDFWSQKLYDMGAGNEFTGVYSKGPLALHALRGAVGDRAFFKILKTWPSLHHNGHASWPEFERYVQRVTGKDLRGFFQAWFRAGTEPPARYLHAQADRAGT